MNEHASNPNSADVPEDLRGVADALDLLARLDREAAGHAFEQRLAASTSPVVAAEAQRADALADAERSAASPTLEDRIFVATRALLHRPAVETGAAPAPLQIRTRRLRTALRVAAVVALAAGAVAIYTLTRPDAPIVETPIVRNTDETTPERIAAELEEDFETLASVLSVAFGSAEGETVSTTSADASSLEVGDFELPRFDFLSTEMEGSL